MYLKINVSLPLSGLNPSSRMQVLALINFPLSWQNRVNYPLTLVTRVVKLNMEIGNQKLFINVFSQVITEFFRYLGVTYRYKLI